MWAYPQDADTEINLLWLVASFFALSFGFQLAVMIPCTGGYNKIFRSMDNDDVTFELAQDKGVWVSSMLYFNWLRFVEYSFSGSIVLASIAIVSGIVDSELLLCIVFLSGACMIFGLVAEWCLRILVVLKNSDLKVDAADQPVVKNVMLRMLTKAFWVAHFAGWICIIVPWYIIFKHYASWWGMCKSNSEPPEFVRYIVWLQIVLFASFGVVQFWQWFQPHRRRTAELAYIILSLSAKASLGGILAANVLFQD